jgi:uncharacterized protein YuzE
MKVRYFADTDTALLEFSDAAVEETGEIAQHVTVDLDAAGRLVSMTIEHAATIAQLPTIELEQVGVDAA